MTNLIDQFIASLTPSSWKRKTKHGWEYRSTPPTKLTPDGYLPTYDEDELRAKLPSLLAQQESQPIPISLSERCGMPQIGARMKGKLPPDLLAAVNEAAKTQAEVATTEDGKTVFINYGEEPDYSHLNCPHCGGSGHIDDVKQESAVAASDFDKSLLGVGATAATPADMKVYQSIADNYAKSAVSEPDVKKPLPKKQYPTITMERLKYLVHYDPETGIFTSLAKRSRYEPGDVLGVLSGGYLKINLDCKPYLLHRLAYFYMTGKWHVGPIDHQNHIKTDNRWANLRATTSGGNSRNMTPTPSSKSGMLGVNLVKSGRKWRVQVWANGRQQDLGCFRSLEEAKRVREEANQKYGYHENHGKAIATQSERGEAK